MSGDSVKRLVLLLAGVLLRLLAPKLGLDHSAVDSSLALIGVFLAQSGVKSGLQALADKGNRSPVVTAVLQDVAKVQQAVADTKAGS